MDTHDHSANKSVNEVTDQTAQETSIPDTTSGLSSFLTIQRAIKNPSRKTLTLSTVLQLQRTIGNQAILRLISKQNARIQREVDPHSQQIEQDVQQLQGNGETILGTRIPITPDLLSIVNPTSYEGTRSGEPDLANGDTDNYSYHEIEGEAFIRGNGDEQAVDPNDVDQGHLGDCYLMAVLAAIARTAPNRIENMINGPNDDGNYSVTLFEDTGALPSRGYTEITYTVSPRFPTLADGATPAYAQGGDTDATGNIELWVMLIEKAYAMHVGGYDEADRGGQNIAAMQALVGANAEMEVFMSDEETVANRIHTLITEGHALTASTRNPDSIDENMEQEMMGAGVPPRHAYAVISVDVEARTINLQNPWGQDHLMGFPMRSLLRYFNHINIVRVR